MEIGFLPIRIWDILDIIIVGYLIYRIYKLLKGSVALNIFIGVVSLFVIWWVVKRLNMDLLSYILDQLVNVGVIIIIVIFQPEVRRFLLLIGNSTLKGRSSFWNSILSRRREVTLATEKKVIAVSKAVKRIAKTRMGGLIVFSQNTNIEEFSDSGVLLNAEVSAPLLESIFNKESPLHDGAVIITNGKLYAASCVLPLSDSKSLPKWAGLRHRAGVGVTQNSSAEAIIISEESGNISFAKAGQLEANISDNRLQSILTEHFSVLKQSQTIWSLNT